MGDQAAVMEHIRAQLRAHLFAENTFAGLYSDPNGKVALKFDVTQVTTPSTLILDRQGRIAIALRRPTIVSELQPLVERVAAEETG